MKLVIISSTQNITVTHGLSGVDNTNPKVVTGNSLNVGALWTKDSVDIKIGQNKYPADIVDWPTVKMLAEKKIITIGAIVDDTVATEAETTAAKKFEAAEADVEAKSNIDTPKRKSKQTEDATEPTIEK